MDFITVLVLLTPTLFVGVSFGQNVTSCIRPRPGFPCRQNCRSNFRGRPRRAAALPAGCNQTCLHPLCIQECNFADENRFNCPLLRCDSGEWCSQQCSLGRCMCTSRGTSFAVSGCDQKCNQTPRCIELTCNSKTSCVQQCRGGSCNCNADGICRQLCKEIPCEKLRCAAKFCTQESKNCNRMECSSSTCLQQCDAGRCKEMKCDSDWCSQTCKKNTSICAMHGKAKRELTQICEGNCSASCTGGAQCIQTCHSNSPSCTLISSTPNTTQTCEASCATMLCTSEECSQVCKKNCQNMTCSGKTCKQNCTEGGCRMECKDSVELCVQNCGDNNCTFNCEAKRCQACYRGNCSITNNKGKKFSSSVPLMYFKFYLSVRGVVEFEF